MGLEVHGSFGCHFVGGCKTAYRQVVSNHLLSADLIDGCNQETLFFLDASIDQVAFMESLLQPPELLRRMKLYVDDEVAAGRLPRGSLALLREAFLSGELERGLLS